MKTRRRLSAACLLAAAFALATPAASEEIATSPPVAEPAADAVASGLAAIRVQLDDGDWDGARAGLMQLVASVSRQSGPDGLKELGYTTLDTFVGRRMLPAAILHLDLYREARTQRAYDVSTHSRQVYLSLVRRLATSNSLSPQSAASLYVLLADELHLAGVLSDSVIVYRHALELDPDDTAARLRLAIRLEQRGLDAEAAEEYETLVAKKPDHDEAAVRLAVALGRLGQHRAKQRALEALVAREPEPWILTVAYEELAADRLRENGPQAARDLLREAVARLPDQPRLVLQLAFVLDALGERGSASKLLAELPSAADGAGGSGEDPGEDIDNGSDEDLDVDPDEDPDEGSPRHRLARWTTDDDTDRYERLRGMADEQIAALRGGAP